MWEKRQNYCERRTRLSIMYKEDIENGKVAPAHKQESMPLYMHAYTHVNTCKDIDSEYVKPYRQSLEICHFFHFGFSFRFLDSPFPIFNRKYSLLPGSIRRQRIRISNGERRTNTRCLGTREKNKQSKQQAWKSCNNGLGCNFAGLGMIWLRVYSKCSHSMWSFGKLLFARQNFGVVYEFLWMVNENGEVLWKLMLDSRNVKIVVQVAMWLGVNMELLNCFLFSY